MWKKIQEPSSDIHNFNEVNVLEGILKSKEENMGQRKNSNLYTLNDGTRDIKFWGTTVLDGKLAKVEKYFGYGTKVRITFNGEVEAKKGGANYKDFDVEAWEEEDVIDKDGKPLPKIKESISELEEDIPVINAEDVPF
jgi:hypothetical protein